MSNCQPGICRNPLHDHPFDRTQSMTPKTDSVAVLRERIENVARDVDPNDSYDSGMNFKQIASELRAVAAALSAQGEAVAEVGNEGSVVWLTLNPPKRGASLYLHPAPPGAGDAVTEARRNSKLVPLYPTEAQWGGLARDIVMWWTFERRTGAHLFRHLERCGTPIPGWLREEVPDVDHVPHKGTVAAIIYRAMLEAAP